MTSGVQGDNIPNLNGVVSNCCSERYNPELCFSFTDYTLIISAE